MSDLAGDILARVQSSQPGPATWFTRLPVEIQGELDGLRQKWIAGKVPIKKRPLARAIIDTMRERGHQTAGLQGVEDWLHGGRHR